MKVKYEGNQRRIREIAATQLLQEELAKVDPCLVSISAFLGTVCGTDKGTVKLSESVKLVICSERPRAEEVLEQVLGASHEEVDKSGNVVAPMVNVGEIGAVAQVAVPAEMGGTMAIIAESAVMADSSASVIASATESIQEREDAGELEDDRTDAISIADTVMSVEGSSSGGFRSHSTCGSFVSAPGMRKRAADGSPERDSERNSRRDFPGRVTRSAAGCRIYLPTIGDDNVEYPGRIPNDDGTIAKKMTVG